MMVLDLQTTQTGVPTVPERQGAEVMSEQTLQAELMALSQEIAVLRAQEALLAEQDRLAWEIALLGALYRREALSGELLLRQMDHLEQCWTVSRMHRD